MEVRERKGGSRKRRWRKATREVQQREGGVSAWKELGG